MAAALAWGLTFLNIAFLMTLGLLGQRTHRKLNSNLVIGLMMLIVISFGLLKLRVAPVITTSIALLTAASPTTLLVANYLNDWLNRKGKEL